MKTSIARKLRNYFITGVVVLIPIGITLYLTLFIVKISSKILPAEVNPNNYLPFSIPGLESLLSIIFITFIGGLSLSFIWIEEDPKYSDIANVIKCMSINEEAMHAVWDMGHKISFGSSALTRAQEEIIATVVSSINHCKY